MPVTSNNPEDNCLRNTTLLPRNRPANRMRIVPGVIDARNLGGLRTGIGPFFNTTSSAG